VLEKPFRDVAKKMELKYAITARAMRRTFQDSRAPPRCSTS